MIFTTILLVLLFRCAVGKLFRKLEFSLANIPEVAYGVAAILTTTTYDVVTQAQKHTKD